MLNLENPFDVWILKGIAWQYQNSKEKDKNWKVIIDEKPERISEFLNLLHTLWLAE
jgi:hypothetical protein